MRRQLIAGNWKMNLDRAASVELARILATADLPDDVDVAVCPPHVYLESVGNRIKGTSILLGAQDVYFQPSGAFTGEISTAMLKDLDCDFVILGHSERRNIIGESSELVNRKVRAVLESGMIPILCVGELLDQREAGRTLQVVRSQFEQSLEGVTATEMQGIVLAYEPVWAIGTGKTATPGQAQQVHADLRKIISERYNRETSESVRILYGGSVKPDNAAELLAQTDIDGALVGGASLDAADFIKIIAARRSSVAHGFNR